MADEEQDEAGRAVVRVDPLGVAPAVEHDPKQNGHADDADAESHEDPAEDVARDGAPRLLLLFRGAAFLLGLLFLRLFLLLFGFDRRTGVGFGQLIPGGLGRPGLHDFLRDLPGSFAVVALLSALANRALLGAL